MTKTKAISLDKVYSLIGEFVSKANTIEFLVNICLEQILNNLQRPNDGHKAEINYTIDNIHEQSGRARISNIILLLTISVEISPPIEELISFFKTLYKHYNKKIRDNRDIIAHNPYIEGTQQIINSRRFKRDVKLQSILISDLPQLINEITPYLIVLNEQTEFIQTLYPGEEVLRDFKPLT
jgi:hypothetical protein